MLRSLSASLALSMSLIGAGCDRAQPLPLPRHVVVAPAAASAVVVPVAAAEPAPPRHPQRVVIISEDGMRPDALDAALTPRHMRLMREGSTGRQAETIPQSDTLPSHASMLSGFGARAHGLFWNNWKADRGYIHVPTIFSIARAHGLSTAMIVGKPKLRHIARPGTVDHFERPSYLCGGVSRRAAAYFASVKPDLMFVHFSDPDESGHAFGWMSDQYRASVHAADRCLDRLLAAIDASGMGADTLVIVTADHGGLNHKHSTGKDRIERQIPWIVRGPGITPGASLDMPIHTVDTAATTLAALRLPRPPNMAGQTRLLFAP